MSSGGNSTEKHQQGSRGLPVAFEISIAHLLGSPQMGHIEGSIVCIKISTC